VIIRNAKIVSAKGIREVDILIEGERIRKVGKRVSCSGEETVDAAGLYAFFGGMDAHVHFRVPGAEWKEDFYTGTCAALAGGITTVLDMPNTNPPTISVNALGQKKEMARKDSVCDFGFHFGATENNFEEVKKASPSSLKIYMGQSTGGMAISESAIRRHFLEFEKEKPICIHAEDEKLAHELGERNAFVSSSAVCKAIAWAGECKRRVHLCHASTNTEIILAKSYAKASVEAAPHHLFLSQKDEARLGVCREVRPPLRGEEDRATLWGALAQVDIIASDHAPHTLSEKKEGACGFPGVQTMLPLMLDSAKKGRITLEEVARLLCSNPPKIFGIEGKGEIKEGNFADIVLVNMEKKWKVKGEKMFSKCGWTPYEGMELFGVIEKVFLRGETAFEEGEVIAKRGSGKLVMH